MSLGFWRYTYICPWCPQLFTGVRCARASLITARDNQRPHTGRIADWVSKSFTFRQCPKIVSIHMYISLMSMKEERDSEIGSGYILYMRQLHAPCRRSFVSQPKISVPRREDPSKPSAMVPTAARSVFFPCNVRSLFRASKIQIVGRIDISEIRDTFLGCSYLQHVGLCNRICFS